MRVTKQSSQSFKKKTNKQKRSVPHALVTSATAARGSRPALGCWWFATRLFVTARAGRRKLGPRFWRQNLKASQKNKNRKKL